MGFSIFDEEERFLESSLKEYRKVYGMLEDIESQEIYLTRLSWLVSGNPKYTAALAAFCVRDLMPVLREKTMELRNSLPRNRKIVLYGAGVAGKEILPCWEDDSRFLGFCSQTKSTQENGYLGYPCMSPEELCRRGDICVVISVEKKTAKAEIEALLRENKYPEELIFFAPVAPDYAVENQYFSPDFLSYGENEVFLDIGCLDLGSTLSLERHCSVKGGNARLRKAYAFEPDPENYRVCQERAALLKHAELKLIPFGAWNERATLKFSATNDGISHVRDNGEMTVSVLPIDEAVDPKDKVTMIKMDIEGSELNALRGAKAIIQRDRPKLAISIYHKPEDMTKIPLYIKELVPEYRLYIRQHEKTDAEAVLYAVMP